MKLQLLIAAMPLCVLVACNDSEPAVEEAAAPDPLAELAAGTGPYLVSYPDGTQTLSYALEDGTEWGGPIELPAGADPVRWSVVEDRVCIDFPDAMEDAEDFCMNSGELAEDGTWQVVPDNTAGGAEPATMRRLDRPATAPADQISAGTYWVDLPDGESAMVHWGADGTSYLARNPVRSTWRADGNQRCTTPEGGEETCGSPTGEIGPDGTFTAEDGGNQITVRML